MHICICLVSLYKIVCMCVCSCAWVLWCLLRGDWFSGLFKSNGICIFCKNRIYGKVSWQFSGRVQNVETKFNLHEAPSGMNIRTPYCERDLLNAFLPRTLNYSISVLRILNRIILWLRWQMLVSWLAKCWFRGQTSEVNTVNRLRLKNKCVQ